MKNNDLFAFPVPGEEIRKTIDLDGYESTFFRNGYNGMTLRDYFAGQILIGYSSNPSITGSLSKIAEIEKENPCSLIAKSAYEFADAMLAEREKGEER